ncbi:MAG TPA: dipeptidase [Pyrinomonadaceae bacterium]|jgi:membrane dipeptidase|nr:dipeptidase [Pyrinomonadaceae bacterium]
MPMLAPRFVALSAALSAALSLACCRTPGGDLKKEETIQTKNAAADAGTPAPSDSGAHDAASIHRRAVAIDMHADTVQFMLDEGADINQRLTTTHLDSVRMREGGLDAQFFSIWVEPQFYGLGGERAVARADEQIKAVRSLAEQQPETWVLATTAEDVRRAAREGKLAALLGLEGGYAIDEKLESVERYYRMGVRYISPTWTYSVSWAGSSGDGGGRNVGLNDFGRQVIREMNRLGIIVDVSHVSDKTFWDIVETSTKPVVATHSNCRAIVNVARNLTDEQIQAIAKTGGVVSVVFYPGFVEPGWMERKNLLDREIEHQVREAGRNAEGGGSAKRIARDRVREREYARRLSMPTVARVVDHIDHVVKLVGVDHVGVGSDFDGIPATPEGLSSVADLPNLTAELLRRGYTEEDVAKILGGNILRVMEEVERGTQ